MDIHIRRMGRAGRITLHRPKALNALTYPMAVAIEKALDDWRDDDAVKLVVIDAEGDKAFCAGGDIQDLYRTAVEGNFEYGRTFWRDEYRLNAKIAAYPKPFVALMQGFVMGGGVGISCHGSHRIACENTQIAMPECGIGLVGTEVKSLRAAAALGRIDQMAAVYQKMPLNMGWCLDCHRNPAEYIRPRSEITTMGYKPEGESQAELGPRLVEEYHVNPQENCYTCHR